MILHHLLKDHDVQTGAIGTIIVIAARWVAENISPLLGILAGFGGVIVVILSIKEKVKKNKLLDLEIKELEEKLKS